MIRKSRFLLFNNNINTVTSTSASISLLNHQLKTGLLSPQVAFQKCRQLLQQNNNSDNSDDNISAVIDFTSNFSSVFVPVLSPDQLVSLFAVKNQHPKEEEEQQQQQKQRKKYYWWNANSITATCEHSQLVSSVLKRAASHRQVLSIAQLTLCLRVAVNRFGVEDSLSHFYNQFADELANRLEKQQQQQQQPQDEDVLGNLIIKEIAIDLVRLLIEMRLQNNSNSNKKKFDMGKQQVSLEGAILIYFDEVVFPILLLHHQQQQRDHTQQFSKEKQQEQFINLCSQFFSLEMESADDANAKLRLALCQETENLKLMMMQMMGSAENNKSSIKTYESKSSALFEQLETLISSEKSDMQKLDLLEVRRQIISELLNGEDDEQRIGTKSQLLISLAYLHKNHLPLTGDERKRLESFLGHHGLMLKTRQLAAKKNHEGQEYQQAVKNAIAILLDETP